MRRATLSFALIGALTTWIGALTAPPALAQWQPLGLSGRQIHRLAAIGGNLYACASDGLHRIALGAPDTTWTPLAFGGQNVLDVAALPPDTLLVAKGLTGAPADTISIFRSIDAGTSWQPFQNGFGAGSSRQARRLLPLSGFPGTILAVGGDIEKSTDGGRSWRVVYQGNAVNALEQSPANPQLLWAGGETLIFSPYAISSSNAGETWKAYSLFAGGDNAVDGIAPHPTDPNVVYLGMEGRVMKSEDGGTTWWTQTSPNPSLYTYGMAARPTLPLKLFAAGASTIPDPRGVVYFESNDGGLSWRDFSLAAYAGFGVNHLLYRTEGAAEAVYLATGNGVFRHAAIPVGVETPPAAPRVSLRCRPNPFRRAAEIHVTMPSAQRASLVVLDMRGRTVARLVDRTLDAGLHRVPWDAKGIGSGIYFCRLETEGRVTSLKVLRLP